MSFFSSHVGDSKPTKYLIASRVAALLMCVKDDINVCGLIAGSIVLNTDFTVAFRGGSCAPNTKHNVCAKVNLKKFFTDDEIQNDDIWLTDEALIIDRLAYTVTTEFSKQSRAFANIEKMFKRTGNYVFVGKSAQYLNAEKKQDQNQKEALLRQSSEIHYIMETYENMGAAKAREREMAGTFVGGVVSSYELLIG